MINIFYLIGIFIFLRIIIFINARNKRNKHNHIENSDMAFHVKESEEEWRRVLPMQSFFVLRKGGRERPFSSELYELKETGIYCCKGCSTEIFSSRDKFDAGTGWPSFSKVISEEKIGLTIDYSFNPTRTAVYCTSCGGHLGHLFHDETVSTGQRFCINSMALEFLADEPSQ